MPFMIIPIAPIMINIFISDNSSLPKQLLFVQYEYLFDIKKYYYPVMLHSYLGTCAFINVIVALDTTCMVYNLSKIDNETSHNFAFKPTKYYDKSHEEMIKCMELHQRILDYAKLIEDSHYISYFFQLGINMICISFTGFQIATKFSIAPDVSIRFAAFTSTQLAFLFLQSFPGQQLSDSSSQVFQDVYSAKWYKTSMRTRKLFFLMSMRSAKPCILTAGRFYVLGLANFGTVVRTSISYVMVLLSME
ncbi:odorant receptor 9a-like [Aphidius gifuensis]|uniref:odorant receptor 9a-like n=1 Tax=Aphidius gifuensis TaxID=684658 RepID=UPI001CDBF29C|nr:odorant receptor 9a-like [Aphidius gifuensis]